MLKTLINLIIDSLFPRKNLDSKIQEIDFDFMQNNFPKPHLISIKNAYSIYSYKNEMVKNIVWNIKYKKSDEASLLSAIAINWKIEQLFGKNKVIVIPIPSSWRRKNERGYNQIEFIIEKIKTLPNNKQKLYINLIKRKTHLDSQTKKDRRHRLESTDIFEIDHIAWKLLPSDYADYTYIIIDDVLTTGQTMQQAINTLLGAGLQKVYGITFAH